MVTEQVLNNRGDIVYEKHSDGYYEYNTYDEFGCLIRSEQHYANGLVEVEQWKGGAMSVSA